MVLSRRTTHFEHLVSKLVAPIASTSDTGCTSRLAEQAGINERMLRKVDKGTPPLLLARRSTSRF